MNRITIHVAPGCYIIKRPLFIPSHVFLRGGEIPARSAADHALNVGQRQPGDENLPALPTIEVWSLDDIPGERVDTSL